MALAAAPAAASAASAAVSRPDPFLALGMVSAPANFERRQVVRRDMLDLPSVRGGAVVFRFLLGRVAPSARLRWGSHQELQAEESSSLDVLLLDALDGPGPNKQCSCLEAILNRFGVVWGWIWGGFGWIWGRFGLICWICLIFFGGLALMRSNVPQVSQTFF